MAVFCRKKGGDRVVGRNERIYRRRGANEDALYVIV